MLLHIIEPTCQFGRLYDFLSPQWMGILVLFSKCRSIIDFILKNNLIFGGCLLYFLNLKKYKTGNFKIIFNTLIIHFISLCFSLFKVTEVYYLSTRNEYLDTMLSEFFSIRRSLPLYVIFIGIIIYHMYHNKKNKTPVIISIIGLIICEVLNIIFNFQYLYDIFTIIETISNIITILSYLYLLKILKDQSYECKPTFSFKYTIYEKYLIFINLFLIIISIITLKRYLITSFTDLLTYLVLLLYFISIKKNKYLYVVICCFGISSVSLMFLFSNINSFISLIIFMVSLLFINKINIDSKIEKIS